MRKAPRQQTTVLPSHLQTTARLSPAKGWKLIPAKRTNSVYESVNPCLDPAPSGTSPQQHYPCPAIILQACSLPHAKVQSFLSCHFSACLQNRDYELYIFNSTHFYLFSVKSQFALPQGTLQNKSKNPTAPTTKTHFGNKRKKTVIFYRKEPTVLN